MTATPVQRLRAYGVHLLTASGIVFMFLAAAELTRPEPRAWLVFVWFIGATITDAIDGPLARRWQVKRYAGDIDGRTIDDLVDYIAFSFLPLLLIWRMGWVPGGNATWAGVWVVIPMLASLLGFAHNHAKAEEEGFFRGFPSYWNIVAIYAGLSASLLGIVGVWLNAVLLLGLAVLTVLPVWLIYPNLAPRPWKPAILYGSYAWTLLLVAMLPWFPHEVPAWLVLVSLIYPAFYLWLSLHLRARWPTRPSLRDIRRVLTG